MKSSEGINGKKKKPVRPFLLKKNSVLGLNARNLLLFETNNRKYIILLNNKIKTKQLCREIGIPAPATIDILKGNKDIKKLDSIISGLSDFVIKPANSFGGQGILIISNHDNYILTLSGGEIMDISDIKYHSLNILAGLYSFHQDSDYVIIEERIISHPVFSSIVSSGLPDIRIIMYQCRPIMAMLRIPTSQSKGKANLHKGGIGLSLDINTGITGNRGVYKERVINCHPDNQTPFSNISIPYWEEILRIAIHFSKAVLLNYIGIDIVIDKEKGPLLLEANARPGLIIQIVNRCGLKSMIDNKN